jgi:hypothetical protein
MTKLIVALRNFANAPNSESEQVQHSVINSSYDPRFKVNLVDRSLLIPVAQKLYRRTHTYCIYKYHVRVIL